MIRSFNFLGTVLMGAWLAVTGGWLRAQDQPAATIAYQDQVFQLYPATLAARPDIPSPWTTPEGTEVIRVRLKDGRYALIPVTVEKGSPLLYSNRIDSLFGKDNQLHVDSGDFPTLARTGLHAESELAGRGQITGYPVSLITYIGRPGRLSGAGFMADDEDILSVLRGDNRTVGQLGLTHPRLARPLFHVWNIILKEMETGNWTRFWDHIPAIDYNGGMVHLTARGHKGWQVSIFQDEIQGRFDIGIRRELSAAETDFLKKKYAHLPPDQFSEMADRLTRIGFSEMVPYYIMHYGFYEGHTNYRCDPLAIARIFGLKSVEEMEMAFPGRLFETLTRHFTPDTVNP